MTKGLSLITICKKAGMLVLGMDQTKEAINKNLIRAVVVTNDISPKSLKEVMFFLKNKKAPLLSLDADAEEIWGALGRKSVVIGITDDGFTKKLVTMLPLIERE